MRAEALGQIGAIGRGIQDKGLGERGNREQEQGGSKSERLRGSPPGDEKINATGRSYLSHGGGVKRRVFTM